MSQPPLTEQIKVLEHSLKLKLFERSRRGTQLSPAGAAILPAVRQFAFQVEHLERVVREAFNQRRKTLRNTLKQLLPAEAIEAAGVDGSLRPEQLDLAAFVRLADQLAARQSAEQAD